MFFLLAKTTLTMLVKGFKWVLKQFISVLEMVVKNVLIHIFLLIWFNTPIDIQKMYVPEAQFAIECGNANLNFDFNIV